MSRDEFIKTLKTERKRWEEKWRGINLFKTRELDIPGTMNLRDILFHVAWYEREMIVLMQLKALVGSPWWDLPLDERNAHIHTEGQSLTLLEAFHHEQQAYSELLTLLAKLSDEDLEQASSFRDMPPEWKPWEVIASNTYEHYQQHISDIKMI